MTLDGSELGTDLFDAIRASAGSDDWDVRQINHSHWHGDGQHGKVCLQATKLDGGLRLRYRLAAPRPFPASETFRTFPANEHLFFAGVRSDLALDLSQRAGLGVVVQTIPRTYMSAWWPRDFGLDFRRDPLEPAISNYGTSSAYCMAERAGWWISNHLMYPWVVLERDASYLFIGLLDIGHYTSIGMSMITPGDVGFFRIPTDRPSFWDFSDKKSVEQPLPWKPVQRFDIVVKEFLKEELDGFSVNMWTAIERWYLDHIYSTNPLSGPYVDGINSPEGRGIGRTNIGTNQPSIDADRHDWQEYMAGKTFQTSQWSACLHLRWDNIPPRPINEKETWVNEGGERLSVEAVSSALKSDADSGILHYLYFRQLCNIIGEEGHPYDPDWSARQLCIRDDKEPHIYGNPPVPHMSLLDMCSIETLDWFERDIQETVDFWMSHAPFGGVAWDMSWDVCMHCARHPDIGGPMHGELKLMAEMAIWLREKYPELRIIGNSSGATPVNLWLDHVMCEFGEEINFNSTYSTFLWIQALRTRAYKNNYSGLHYLDPTHPRMRGIALALSMGYLWADAGCHLYMMSDIPGEVDRGPWTELPEFESFEELAIPQRLIAGPIPAFSAQACGLRAVWEPNGCLFKPAPPKRYATAWAGNGKIMVATLCDSEGETQIRLDKKILETYGYFGVSEFNGFAVGAETCIPEVLECAIDKHKDSIIIRFEVEPSNLVLLTNFPVADPVCYDALGGRYAPS